MLLKGTLRSWSVANGTADVQIAGSLGSYLTGVPVSAAVPVWELVAGRTALVAVPDPRAPGDAYVQDLIGAPVGPPRCRAYHSAAQAIASGAPTQLAFDSEYFDSHGCHDPAVNNGRLTAPLAGVYVAAISLYWATNATGYRQVWINRNLTTTLAWDTRPAATGVQTAQSLVTPPFQLTAGDYLTAHVQQNSGGPLNVVSTRQFSPDFGFWLIGT